MRRVNEITYDLIKGEWFMKYVKPEDKGRSLNIVSTDATGKTNYKRVRIR